MPGESRLRENRTSGSEGRAEVADRVSAASPDPTPLEPTGQQNPGRGKGRCFVHASRTGKGR
jgi:hypothetical protein